MTESNRIIILQYTPKCQGIGDFINAAAFLTDYCKSKSISFFIDITNPICNFFEFNRYTGNTSSFNISKNFLCSSSGEARRIYSSLLESNKNIIVKTNIALYRPSFTLLKDIFYPKSSVIEKHNSLLIRHNLAKNAYYCIHIRFGDGVLCNFGNFDKRLSKSSKSIDERIALCLESMTDKNLPVVLITDNYQAKLQLAEKYKFRYFDIKPVHTSYTNDLAAIEQTVLEFLTLTESAGIFAVSTSGFSCRTAAYGGKPYMCAQ